MYNQFFGFKERPFKLVPDPDYLFLSKSHEEALAYLKYAVSEDEGFVEIIGEVGTGKTMLCRAFLENLGTDTESAYIFNPKMNAVDLLKAINDEFGIPSDHQDTKSLIDALNDFLMEKKAQGKKVILIIDEAQNLSKEVLEQIRLLSNLETTKNKLLQIILAGQPELGELLDSYELRQLSQRISLSCRLKPLNFSETKEYIHHRIHVASQKIVAVFTRAAIRRIYKYSGGVPRLINIACDRALLTAYGFNRHRVTGDIAQASILELSSRGEIKRHVINDGKKRLLGLVSLGVVLVLLWMYQTNIQFFIAHTAQRVKLSKRTDDIKNVKTVPLKNEPSDSQVVEGTKKSIEPSEMAIPETIKSGADQSDYKPENVNLDQLLLAGNFDASRNTALKTVLNQWNIDPQIPEELSIVKDDKRFFSLASGQQGLILQEINGDLVAVRNLNLCAILEFKRPETRAPVFLTAVRADDRTMTFLDIANKRFLIAENEEIHEFWTGRAFVFWKNFYNYQGTIPFGAPDESVITLKLHLKSIGFDDIDINAAFDMPTRVAIKTLQARHGIRVDGYVGPLTKIALYNEKSSLPIPHLLKNGVSN